MMIDYLLSECRRVHAASKARKQGCEKKRYAGHVYATVLMPALP